jgi:hypothetical protein
MQEAAANSTAEIIKRETELVSFFQSRGVTVATVDRQEFLDAVKKSATFEEFGYRKADWDKIQAIQ